MSKEEILQYTDEKAKEFIFNTVKSSTIEKTCDNILYLYQDALMKSLGKFVGTFSSIEIEQFEINKDELKRNLLTVVQLYRAYEELKTNIDKSKDEFFDKLKTFLLNETSVL